MSLKLTGYDPRNPHNRRMDDWEFLLDSEDTCTNPDAPTGLTATEISSTRIDLSWVAPAQVVTGYMIERQDDGGVWNIIVADTGNTNTTYSNTGLTAGVIYNYRVSAIQGSCNSTPSGTAEDYTFANADAKTYYNALVTANGGAIDWSIYSTNPRTVIAKEGIDNFFVTGASGGWLAESVGLYLMLGGTAAMHSVNAKTPSTYNITWINTPTQGVNGAGLNGSSQYGRLGITNTGLIQNDVHITIKTIGVTNSGTDTYIGASNGTTQRTQLIHQTTGVLQGQIHNTTEGAGQLQEAASYNVYLSVSRRSSTDIELYQNGVSIDSSSGGGGTEPTVEMYIGCLNNGGTPNNYTNGTFQFACVGNGLTDAEVLSLVNAATTLNSIFGR